MAPSAVTVNQPFDPTLTWKEEIRNRTASIVTKSAEIKERNPLTIDELIRARSQSHGDEVIFSYPSSGTEYVDYTYRQLDIYASRLAQKYQSVIPQRTSSAESESVVGLLGPSNFEYFISILALTKLGHTVLFLSTRISPAAYASLLRATSAEHILIDKSFASVVDEVKNEFPALRVHEIEAQGFYDYPITDSHEETRFDYHLRPEDESKRISWIIHSSGSTGLPKPIYQTHLAALTNYASNLNLRGFITLPLYHAHGISSVFRAIHSRKQIYLYNATLPLSQNHLLNIMDRYRFQVFYGVPYALKLLAETVEGITALTKLDVVMFGGSACPDALGDRLIEHGVNLVSHYGTTETGQLMTSNREPGDKAWDFVRLPVKFQTFVKFEERGPGIFELIALDGLPSKVATNREDGSYATKDLFSPHPSIPNAWKYVARLDDTIVLMNGEKITPINFEQSVRDCKYVSEAVMFGSGKARVGLIIIPSPATRNLSSEELEGKLLPVLVKANDTVPAYAQLSWDMVKILPIGTEYPRTDKGTVIRAAFYRTFDQQIEQLYEQAEVSSGDLCLSVSELRQYLREELSKILPSSTLQLLKDQTDFFSIGIDSLQAIRLRAVISKNIQTNGEKLAQNIVFDYPSLKLLSEELYRIRTGGVSDAISTISQMEQLISKYSVFEPHAPAKNEEDGQYIVVTGATGSLGAHLVSQVVLQPNVKKVYCLVRAKSAAQAQSRVIKSLRERSVHHHLPLSARQKIVALPSDFSQGQLGLEPKIYDRVAAEITCLIHCAWSVNFNLALASFEADCIAGAHNLLALCLKAKRPEPASFNFCSSVSAVAATRGGFVREALPESLDCAQNMGYAQSKLVTEHICVEAAKAYGIKTRVLRVGQVVADTVHGIWNATEAIPLMMQAGLTIGAIPKLDESPLWLPVDVVASAVSDISLSTAGPAVVNVVNHQNFHWTRDLLPALHEAGLEFSEVGQKEWVSLLRKSNPDPVANPPIKLVEFFASKYDNDLPRSGLTYDTSFARFLSPSLQAAPVLGQDLVSKFVRHFKATSWSVTSSSSVSKKKVIVVAGPCGSGKSTVATALSEALNIPWIEGDKLHSKASIGKMSAGQALSDSDRWMWLETLKATALIQMREENREAVIITCSALKKSYRDELRQSRVLGTTFIMLQGTSEILKERIDGRKGHYMGVEMVDGQIQDLEDPEWEETDVIPIDGTQSKDKVLEEIISVLA